VPPRNSHRHTRLVGLTSINAQQSSAVALLTACAERRVWLLWSRLYEHNYCNELLYRWMRFLPRFENTMGRHYDTTLTSTHCTFILLTQQHSRAWQRLGILRLHCCSWAFFGCNVAAGHTHFMRRRRKQTRRVREPTTTRQHAPPLRLCCHTFTESGNLATLFVTRLATRNSFFFARTPSTPSAIYDDLVPCSLFPINAY
jgi:hypothetical protein